MSRLLIRPDNEPEMTDETNNPSDVPDALPPDMAEKVEQMQDDDTLDFDSNQRQAEGWLQVYVECPDCHVPMARTTVESEEMDLDLAHDATKSIHRAVCPDCGRFASHVEVTTVTAEYTDIERAFGEATDER
jgi:hypothetical protein